MCRAFYVTYLYIHNHSIVVIYLRISMVQLKHVHGSNIIIVVYFYKYFFFQFQDNLIRDQFTEWSYLIFNAVWSEPIWFVTLFCCWNYEWFHELSDNNVISKRSTRGKLSAFHPGDLIIISLIKIYINGHLYVQYYWNLLLFLFYHLHL